MATLEELISQREALEKQIAEAKKVGREQGIAKIRELMADLGLTAADLSGSGKAATAKAKAGKGKQPVAAKYRNSETGDTWSGRGLKPRWMQAALAQGRKIEDFAI